MVEEMCSMMEPCEQDYVDAARNKIVDLVAICMIAARGILIRAVSEAGGVSE